MPKYNKSPVGDVAYDEASSVSTITDRENSVSEYNLQGNSRLHFAVFQDNVSHVQEILKGKTPDERYDEIGHENRYGQSPFQGVKSSKMALALLKGVSEDQQSALISKEGKFHLTELQMAVSSGDVSMFKAFTQGLSSEKALTSILQHKGSVNLYNEVPGNNKKVEMQKVIAQRLGEAIADSITEGKGKEELNIEGIKFKPVEFGDKKPWWKLKDNAWSALKKNIPE